MRYIGVLFLMVKLFTVSNVSAESTTPFYNCYTDICNVNDQDQFCSEKERKCRNCLEIVDSCFEPGLPNNCTRTCVDFHVNKEIEKAKESGCEDFGPIKNGSSNSSLLELHSPGDVIYVTCVAGFRLSGHQTLECKPYGHWSHDPPICEEITCPVLQSVHNGKHNGSLTIQHKPGDVLTVKCNPGYQRVGPETTTCNSYGVWQNPLSICQKHPDFPPIKNGKGKEQMPRNEQDSDSIHVTCDKVWMIVGIIEGVIISLGLCYHCYKSFIAPRKQERNATVLKTTKKNGNKDETTLLIEKEEENIIKPDNEHAFQNTDISLHDQKLQREGITLQNSQKCQVPEVHPTSTDYFAFSSNQNDRVTNSPNNDLPSSFISAGEGVPQIQNKHQHNATARESDSQCDEPPGRKPESGNHVDVSFSININSNNSADNSNKLVFGNGTDNLHAKSANISSPSTIETKDVKMKDLKEEVLKSPIEESATFQPSHPQSSPGTENITAFVDDDQEEAKGCANTNEGSCPSFRPINGLAIQQNTNNEQDTARKLAMVNGNLNTGDIGDRQWHIITK